MNWTSLIVSLPAEQSALRMRIWRNVRAAGAATLRDGVYLLPQHAATRQAFSEAATEILAAQGTAILLDVEPTPPADFESLFDRSEDYRVLLTDIAACQGALSDQSANEAQKQARKLRKTLDALAAIDFFPDESGRQVDAAQSELELAIARLLSPDEPHPVDGEIIRHDPADFRGRLWATRARPWVDRLASAWLIRRCIDPEARILWLDSPTDCPPDALGFDFDGAVFSHTSGRVTFETLLASFGLDQPELVRLGGIVHFLDVGGVQPPEAAGIEQVLAGMRATILDDDQLLTIAGSVFDSLLQAFQSTHTKT